MIKNMTNSAKINRNDVLCGRGGLTNSHVGNKHFRCVVAEYQLQYLRAKKMKRGILLEQSLLGSRRMAAVSFNEAPDEILGLQ